MTQKKEPKEGIEKQSKTKIVKLIRLPRDVARQLEEAAQQADVSQSVYVMQLLRAHFKRHK
jgi:predicted HicB family RNase H-like nuclease